MIKFMIKKKNHDNTNGIMIKTKNHDKVHDKEIKS